MTGELRAGVVGLGRMGLPMTRCLAEAGIPVTVHDTRAEAVAAAEAVGAIGAASAADVAAASDVVCIVVLDLPQAEEVMFGPGGLVDGIVDGAHDDLVVCVCSTIPDDAVASLADRAAAHGMQVLDAGVAGGPVSAEVASLVTMVGGPAEVLERVRPVLDAFSAEIVHAGPLGAGMQLKLVKNLGSYLVLCAANEVMRLTESLGIPVEAVNHVNDASNMLQQFWTMTVERPGNHPLPPDAPEADVQWARELAALCRKDLDAILVLADRVGEDLPAARTAHELAPRFFRCPDEGHLGS
jgi:3-hydroxyisobutyrate dehydrogenase